MYALTRTISPYTGSDLFLGLFSDAALAHAGRAEYLRSVANRDPWAEQAYRVTDLDKDVHCEKVEDWRIPGSQERSVFLVTEHIEGMGQVVRRILGVFSTEADAKICAKLSEEGPYEMAPNWCDVEEVLIDGPIRLPMPPNTSLERTRGR